MTLDMSFVHWRDKGDSWRILWDRMGKWLGLFWRWASPTFTTSRTEQKSHVGAGIIGDRLVGQVMVPEVFIVISAVYCNLLIEILDLWLYHTHAYITSKDSSIHAWKRSLPLCQGQRNIPRLLWHKRRKVDGVSACLSVFQSHWKYLTHL